MVGVIYHEHYAYLNILMSDGSTGNLAYTKKQEIKMAKQEQIAKISVY